MRPRARGKPRMTPDVWQTRVRASTSAVGMRKVGPIRICRNTQVSKLAPEVGQFPKLRMLARYRSDISDEGARRFPGGHRAALGLCAYDVDALRMSPSLTPHLLSRLS